MSGEASHQWQWPGGLKVAAIVGLGCLVCLTARANDLFQALETGDTAQIRASIDIGADVNAVDGGEHWSPLMFAAAEGHTDVVRLLLEHKANPALKDTDGDTARSFAAQRGHRAVLDLLSR